MKQVIIIGILIFVVLSFFGVKEGGKVVVEPMLKALITTLGLVLIVGIFSLIKKLFIPKKIDLKKTRNEHLPIKQQILKLKMEAGNYPWDSHQGREIRAEIEKLEILDNE
jgi:uncharacterized membrane protein